MKLSKREIDDATCPQGRKDAIFFDDDLTGFALRVTQAGTKVFLFQYRHGAGVKRLTLGRYGDITPTQARTLAERARGEVAQGLNPVGLRQATKRAAIEADGETRRQRQADTLTLDVLLDRWAELGLKDRSATHRREGPRAVRSVFSKLRTRPAASLTPAEIQATLDAVALKSSTMARRSRDYARAAFNWALRRLLVPSNPFIVAVIDGREESRDRVLSDAELGEAWRAAGELGHPFGPFLRLVFLTLQRRQEVAGMRWSELADNLTTWEIPAERSKNRKAHLVHLAASARAIIEDLKRLRAAARVHLEPTPLARPGRRARPAASVPELPDLVFSTNGRTPISGFSRAMDRIEAQIIKARGIVETGKATKSPGITWRLHDLRRTGVTRLAGLGIPPHVADRLLNHVQGTIKGVAAVYQRHEFLAERKAALDAWAAHVLAVGEPPAAGGKARPRPKRAKPAAP